MVASFNVLLDADADAAAGAVGDGGLVEGSSLGFEEDIAGVGGEGLERRNPRRLTSGRSYQTTASSINIEAPLDAH